MCIFYGRTGEMIEDVPQEEGFLGFRGWRVTSSSYLRSMHRSAVWEPGKPMSANGKPSVFTGKGVYAYQFLYERAGVSSRLYAYGGCVIGLALLWGDVLVFDDQHRNASSCGYMAEFGLPLELWGKASDIKKLLPQYEKKGVVFHTGKTTIPNNYVAKVVDGKVVKK